MTISSATANWGLYFDLPRPLTRSYCLNPARFLKPLSSSSVISTSLFRGGGGSFHRGISISSVVKAAAVVDKEKCPIDLLQENRQPRRDSPCLLVPAGFLVAEGGEKFRTCSNDKDKNYYDLLSVEGKKLVLKKKVKKKKNVWLPWQSEFLSPDDAICFSSSHGWLAFIHSRNCSIYLYNPLLNSFPYIPLPPIETLPSVISSLRCQRHCKKSNTTTTTTEFMIPNAISAVSSRHLSRDIFKKMAFSSPPPYSCQLQHSNDCIAMTIQGYGVTSKLAFCRIGDTSWTALDGKLEHCEHYNDIVYFSEHQIFYALSGFSLVAWDLCNPVSPKCTLITAHRIWSFNKYYSSTHLVVSSGDLLMVKRLTSPPPCYETVAFDVYKLDFVRREWVYLPSLGDRVLFVGANHSESLSAHDFPAGLLIPNSIYFTAEHVVKGMRPRGNDLGYFNLEDRVIHKWRHSKKKKNVQPSPTWFVPQGNYLN